MYSGGEESIYEIVHVHPAGHPHSPYRLMCLPRLECLVVGIKTSFPACRVLFACHGVQAIGIWDLERLPAWNIRIDIPPQTG